MCEEEKEKWSNYILISKLFRNFGFHIESQQETFGVFDTFEVWLYTQFVYEREGKRERDGERETDRETGREKKDYHWSISHAFLLVTSIFLKIFLFLSYNTWKGNANLMFS